MFFLLIGLSALITCRASAYTCLTDDGKPVDWYILYKFPTGTKYAYILPSSQQWTKSSKTVNDVSSMVARTIKQAYNISQNSLSVFYNDERPTSNNLYFTPYATSSQHGHMKGVLSFGRKSDGFWLIHSVPKFPGLKSYAYPSTGVRYGQTMFCITYQYSALKDLAPLILIGRPDVFKSNIPRGFVSDYPTVAGLVKPPISKIKANVTTLKSKGGLNVQHMMKSADFGDDLYSGIVASKLQASLLVEAWRNGAGDMPSNCTAKFKVENIQSIDFNNMAPKFKTNSDHSKWAVGKSRPYVCIGDINRQVSQFKRGGGTNCINLPSVYKQFFTLISDIEKC